MLAHRPSWLKSVETRILLAWLIAAGAVLGFVKLAGEIGEGETAWLDRRLLLALRTPGDPADPIGPRWLEESMRDLTALGGFTVLTLLTAVAVAAFALHRKRLQALVMAATVIAAQASTELLKSFYDRPRPDLVPHGSIVYSQSFPSGHSTVSAAAYLTLAALIASLETRTATKALAFAIAAPLVVMIGFSRVYLGVHWPTDVLGGWVLGSVWALLAWTALDVLRGRSLAHRR